MNEELTQFERPGNPFPGLRPFETEEYNLFFGREGQADELLARLGRTRFLAVVGTSGSGKSSLIRAGLLPALYGGLMAGTGSAWRIAVMRPGHDPLGNLARELAPDSVIGPPGVEDAVAASIIETTLRRSTLGLVDAVRQRRLPAGENVLVVVDQFEELFRFRAARAVAADDEASAFVKLLLEAARQRDLPVYVVLTMRSDFLGDCAQFQGLPEAINDGQYLIPRMTRDERRMAITGPAVVRDGEISPPLVNRLLNDVGDNPDQLPILQHALMRTWDHWSERRRDGEPVGLEDYEAVGTMSAALSKHADEAFDELKDDRSRHVAEVLFKALTERGADNREVRRPTRLREVCEIIGATPAEVERVVEVFRREGRTFLMPPEGVELEPDTIIDISHESLIRNWGRLKEWVKEEADAARIYRRLADAAVAYAEGEGGLLDDVTLNWVLKWRDRYRPSSAWGVRYHPAFDEAMSYLDKSIEAREASAREREKQRLEREQQQQELLALTQQGREQAEHLAAVQERAAGRMKLLAVGMAFMLLLALAGAGYAYTMGQSARASERRALDSEQRARDSERAALAAKDTAEEANRRLQETIESEKQAKLAAEASAQKALDEQKRAEAEEGRANEQAEKAAESARRADASRKAEETARKEAERKQEQLQAALERSNLLRRGLEESRREDYDESLTAFDCLRQNIEAQLPDVPPPPPGAAPRPEAGGRPCSAGASKDASEQLAVQLGWVYSNIGGVSLKKQSESRALDAYDYARAVLAPRLPEGDPILLDTYEGLAHAYHRVAVRGYSPPEGSEGKDVSYEEAQKKSEEYYRRLLELQKKHADPETVAGAAAAAEVYADLGRLFSDVNNAEKAVESFKLVVEMRKKVIALQTGVDTAPADRLVDALKELANFYTSAYRVPDAIQTYNEVIDLQENFDLNRGREIADSYSELGQLYQISDKAKAGDAFDVANLLQQATLKSKRNEDESLCQDLIELGPIYVRLGRPVQAAQAYEVARVRAGGSACGREVELRMAELERQHFKDYQKAEIHYRNFIEAYERSSPRGRRGPLVLAQTQLGSLYANELNRPADAAKLYETAVANFNPSTYEDWALRDMILVKLAGLRRGLGDEAGVGAAYRERVNNAKSYTGRGHDPGGTPAKRVAYVSAFLSAINDYADYTLKHGTEAQAADAYLDGLDIIYVGATGTDDPAVLAAYVSTAEKFQALHRKLGRPGADEIDKRLKKAREMEAQLREQQRRQQQEQQQQQLERRRQQEQQQQPPPAQPTPTPTPAPL